MRYDLVIIGAGAAGLFAAANAPLGWNTLVLEKTAAPGQKLLLAGSGQCNVTKAGAISDFLARYGKQGKRLRPVLFPFSNRALMAYFEQRGLPLETRSDGKVFPASFESQDVLQCLLAEAQARGVKFQYHAAVTEISPRDGAEGFVLSTSDGAFLTKRVLVATGGASYPKTGSDGTFFDVLAQLGLTLVPRRPALAPIFVKDYPYTELSGISFQNAAITITPKADRRPIRTTGDLLLTHRGFSGPAILESSRYVAQGDKLEVNYLPGQDTAALRRTLLTAATGDQRQIATLLESLTGLPRRFLERICQRANLAPLEKAARLSGREMGALSVLLTADAYEITGTGGFAVAMVTAGGVDLEEVELRTMESRRYPGLYFAGEVLDVDGDTGGYNLQFAFSAAMRNIEAMQADSSDASPASR